MLITSEDTLELQTIYRDVAIQIHNAIHNPSLINIKLQNEKGIIIPYIISRASNGCRQLVYNGIRFMEQNENKGSSFARLAKEGHKITWGIREKHEWLYIIDGKLIIK